MLAKAANDTSHSKFIEAHSFLDKNLRFNRHSTTRQPGLVAITPTQHPPRVLAALKAVENTTAEIRIAHRISGDFIRLHKALKPRWEEYKKGNKAALAPCPLVNASLSEFVNLTLRVYTPEKLSSIRKVAAYNDATSKAIQELRQIAIHAEGEMEQEALRVIFQAVKECPDYIARINRLAKVALDTGKYSQYTKYPEQAKKLAKLEALVVLLPAEMQKTNPALKGQIFPYFHNYPPLIHAELELLKKTFGRQQNKFLCAGIEGLQATNPGIYLKLKEIVERKEQDRVFTFVGSGFPLSGIIQHIITGGSTINLVDCDNAVVDTTNRLIGITNALGITRAGKINVIEAYAQKVTYLPIEPGKRRAISKGVIYTDVLELASAIPAETVEDVMEKNAQHIPIIIKRNVCGASEFLYEKFALKQSSTRLQKVSETLPPQSFLSMQPTGKHDDRSTAEHLVLVSGDPLNVNSTEAYVPARGIHTEEYIRNSGGMKACL